MKYTIIADSSHDLKSTDFTSTKFDFVTIPLIMTLSGKEWVDEENLEIDKFISAMKSNKDFPRSSCPAPETFAEKMRSGSDNIIVITLSAKISGTYNSACVAANTVRAEQPHKNIYVLDSMTTSAGGAHIIHRLVELIEKGGHSFEKVVKRLEEIRSNTKIRFMLNDTSNLVKTGRMSKVVGLILSILPIKIICGDNGKGEIVKYGQALGMKRGLQTLADSPKEKVAQEGVDIPITISHCQNEEDAGIIKKLLASKFGIKNVITLVQRGIASFYACDKGIAIAY